MEEVYKSIALVEQNMISKTDGKRKIIVIPRVEREPPNNETESAIKEANRHPKLKMFFPELYTEPR